MGGWGRLCSLAPPPPQLAGLKAKKEKTHTPLHPPCPAGLLDGKARGSWRRVSICMDHSVVVLVLLAARPCCATYHPNESQNDKTQWTSNAHPLSYT